MKEENEAKGITRNGKWRVTMKKTREKINSPLNGCLAVEEERESGLRLNP